MAQPTEEIYEQTAELTAWGITAPAENDEAAERIATLLHWWQKGGRPRPAPGEASCEACAEDGLMLATILREEGWLAR